MESTPSNSVSDVVLNNEGDNVLFSEKLSPGGDDQDNKDNYGQDSKDTAIKEGHESDDSEDFMDALPEQENLDKENSVTVQQQNTKDFDLQEDSPTAPQDDTQQHDHSLVSNSNSAETSIIAEDSQEIQTEDTQADDTMSTMVDIKFTAEEREGSVIHVSLKQSTFLQKSGESTPTDDNTPQNAIQTDELGTQSVRYVEKKEPDFIASPNGMNSQRDNPISDHSQPNNNQSIMSSSQLQSASENIDTEGKSGSTIENSIEQSLHTSLNESNCSSSEWKINEDSTSLITPEATTSDLRNRTEKLTIPPLLKIQNEITSSLLDEYYYPGSFSSSFDSKKEEEALAKELDREINRRLPENSDGMLSQPNVQPNERLCNSQARFVSMEEFLNQFIDANIHVDLSDSPKSLTEKERALFDVMTDEEKRLFRWHNVIDELLETEESYTRDLYILCTYFFRILQKVQYITIKDKNAICRNGEIIAKTQEDFCDSLRTAVTYDRDIESVRNTANCFIEAKNYFYAYFDYSMGQDEAITVYNKLIQTNPEFRDLDKRLHLFHRVSWGLNRLKFEDYLIMPFQRLFRYKLLLKALRKATSPKSDGYELLEVAENMIHDVATKINNSKAKIELETKSVIFLSRLQIHWCLPKYWYKYLGACSLIGTLEVRYLPKQRISKRLCCALFEHYLILVKPKKSDVYEPKQWFPIREFSVEDITDMPTSVNFPWLLRSKTHVFEFGASSEAEKCIWMQSMRDCIEIARRQYTTAVRNSNKYLVEQVFVSSLDNRAKNRLAEVTSEVKLDPKSNEHISVPSGSASYSQSAIFNKPSRNNNRLSIPNFSTILHQAPDSVQSPTSGRYLLRGALSERFVSYKMKQFKTRCDAFDANFKDVYISCLITSKGSIKKKP